MTAITQALSAALLHFILQGTLVACLLWIALAILRNRTSGERYLACCAALALLAALPAITAWMLYRQPAAAIIASTISSGTTLGVYAARIARQSPPLAWITLWRQWTLPVWSLGVFVFALRLVVGYRYVVALRRLGHAAESRVTETVSMLARRMKTTRAIRVLISTVAESPSVVGWLRPVILLPAATLAGLEPDQLHAVLAHEIAHIRRHDYLVNLAQTLVETLLFYHPAVWWASARIRHERELCCDDAAVAACGDAIAYARALTALERVRAATPRLAVGSTGGSLLYRIQRLAGIEPESRSSKLPGLAALILGLACFAMTVHWAKAQQIVQPQMPEEWGITVSSTGKILHRERVPYPEATYKDGIQGTVTLLATLDQSGNVTDARVLSGPPELRKTALQSVLQWQFENVFTGETQHVSITFEPDARAKSTELDALLGQIDELTEQIANFKQANQGRLLEGADTDQFSQSLEMIFLELNQKLANLKQIEALGKDMDTASFAGSRLARIEVSGLQPSERDQLTARMTIELGDILSQESIDAAIAAIQQFNPHLECRFLRAANGDVVLRIDGH